MSEGRESSRQEGRRTPRRQEFTVFVDNLPHKLDQYGLKGVFKKAGNVSDVYIPFKKARRRRFGFVRFWNRGEATRSVLLLNNFFVRGSKIHVSMAKYEKKGGRSRHSTEFFSNSKHNLRQTRKVWRQNGKVRGISVEANDLRVSQDQQGSTLLQGKVNSEFLSWLDRSLVCTSDDPRDLGALASALTSGYEQCITVRALSSFKFILTFPTTEQMEEALKNHEDLNLWFSEVKRWDRYEYCEARRVWLEIIGVPPHGWKWENFKKIAELWGVLICLGKPIIRTDSFESMNVLIATDILRSIHCEFILHIEDLGFRVMVKEIGPASQAFQACQNVQSSKSPAELEAMDSNEGVLGFEDIEDGIASADEAKDQSKRPGTRDEEAANNHEAVKETVNGPEGIDQLDGSPRDSYTSTTRTKTAIFSQNDFSNEIFKTSKHVSSLGLGAEEQQPVEKEYQPLPGTFVNDNDINGNSFASPQAVLGNGVFPSQQLEDKSTEARFPSQQVEDKSIGARSTNKENPIINRRVMTRSRSAMQSNKENPIINRRVMTRSRSAMQSNKEDFNRLMLEKGSFQPQRIVQQSQGLGNLHDAFPGVNGYLSNVQKQFEEGEIQMQQQEETSSQPPGFERPIKAVKGKKDCSVQGLKVKGKKCSNGHSEPVSSSHTSDSIQKIAKEALLIGEALGIKVVQHERGAISRITSTLKKSRVQKSKKVDV